MAVAVRRWRRCVLPTLLTCLPAAAAHASKLGSGSESLVEPAALIVLAMVAGALLGWTSMDVTFETPRAARLGRWMLVGAAALLIAGTVACVLMATTPEREWFQWACLCIFHVAMGSGFVIAHAVRLARGCPRSWWLAELGAVAGVAAVTSALGWDLDGASLALAVIAGALAILSLLAASIAAFRADAASAARAHGRTLRIALVSSAVIIAIVGVHLRTLDPRDLESSYEKIWPSGDWIGVSGQARWPASYEPGYLMNVRTGRWMRHGAWISDDGRIAVRWPESKDERRPRPVFVRNLDSPELGQRRLRSVRADVNHFEMLLSPSGRFLLVRERGQLVVVDVEADRVTKRFDDVVGAGRRQWRLDDDGRLRLLFAPRATWQEPARRVEIYDEDPEHQLLRISAVIEAPANMIDPRVYWTTFVGDERLRVAWRGPDQHRRLTLHDARDGRQLGVVADGDRDTPTHLMALADGRLVHAGAGRDTLEVFTSDGMPERIVDVPRARDATHLVGEESPGRIVIHSSDRDGRRVVLVDVDRGEVCAVAPDLAPVSHWDVEYRIGTLATRLFRGTSESNYGQLIEVDWATGARRVVLPH